MQHSKALPCRGPARRFVASVLVAVAVTCLPVPGPGAEIGAVAGDVHLAIDSAAGRPGETVRLTLSAHASTELQAISIAIDFDESRLRIVSVERLAAPAVDGGEPWPASPLAEAAYNNTDETAGNQSGEGWLYLELRADGTATGLGLRPGEETPLVALDFRVADDALPGDATVVFGPVGSIGDETGPAAAVFDNAVVPAGLDAADRVPLPVENLKSGKIKIIGEIGFFTRGDANLDLQRDISDPIRILDRLFLGAPPLACQDAADANDDGILDITDPVVCLERLFTDPRPFPDPDVWGPDPTEDKLLCEWPGPS